MTNNESHSHDRPSLLLRVLALLSGGAISLLIASLALATFPFALGASRLSPTLSLLLLATVGVRLVLMPFEGILYFGMIHRLGTMAEERRLPLRASPTWMVLNYVHPLFSLVAPPSDLIDVDRLADGDDVDPTTNSPNEVLIRAWWAILLAWAAFVVASWFVPGIEITKLGLAFTSASAIAVRVLGLTILFRIEARLRNLGRSEDPSSLVFAQNP